MKIKLVIAMIVFAISMFCGLVIVTNGVLAGRYETLFPYTERDVCTEGETLVLEKETSTTGGSVVVDNNVYDTGFTANTLFCVNATGDKRDVTNETYLAVEKLKSRIGWWSTIGFFLVTMILILLFEKPILRRVDKVIGYKPPEEK
ncbi:MAG TPA: hypothetical protein DIW23_09775 [Anaerolineae bacterium]|nr:hypothetical protein [Anaerolineae bacterium]HRJ74520.1 hypothetical protein [Anaerolineales bacterium]